VHTLRSWEDCDAILDDADEARHVVVVGSSFIGMETAASLLERGKDVTVLSPEAVPFARSLGPEVGGVLRALHEEKGVRFRLGHLPVAFRGDAAVEAVELDDGERLPAELVIVGIGVRPATDFVRGIGLEDDGGITVDSQLRVAPGVWAAGDVAWYPEPHVGEAVRIEHWRLALQHGRAAAFSMANGEDLAFTGVPFFWTRQLGLRLGFVGVGRGWIETIVDGDPAGRDFTVFYAKEDRLRAACGTRDDELNAFAELMRTGALPTASELRRPGAPRLADLLARPGAHGGRQRPAA
jgi:NADPH-dependent 2,4-dienoyl-CoA reductase/sulfur reductase-like enzyme